MFNYIIKSTIDLHNLNYLYYYLSNNNIVNIIY